MSEYYLNQKYKDVWDNDYPKIDPIFPILIHLDGKKVTRNHKKYNMMSEENNFTQILFDCGKKLFEELSLKGHIYAATDEISFIIENTEQLVHHFKVGNSSEYILAMFFQKYLKLFWEFFPEVYLKPSITNIYSNKIERYLEFRKEVCYDNAVIYIAKEFLSPPDYTEKRQKEILNVLKERDLIHHLDDHPVLKDGLYYSNTQGISSSNDDSLLTVLCSMKKMHS